MLTSVAGLPSWSTIIVWGGMWTSRPGICGVVTTTSLVVGEGMRTACAVSIRGSQMVKGSTVVRPAAALTKASNRP
jgi:hypothetical protein